MYKRKKNFENWRMSLTTPTPPNSSLKNIEDLETVKLSKNGKQIRLIIQINCHPPLPSLGQERELEMVKRKAHGKDLEIDQVSKYGHSN